MTQNEKFQHQYRIPSNRLQGWNYAWNGTYFITICTQKRRCYFGDIQQNEIFLTELGKQAEKFAVEIPQHFPFVIMDGFVIMPNHVHLLFTICNMETDIQPPDVVDNDNNVETQNFASLRMFPSLPFQNTFGPQSKNVASIVRGFKIGVTKYARNHGIDFAWQTRFYDHIVRNEQAYNRIFFYIQNNINQWNKDSLKT
ncbi:MAG: hypothetical protein PHC83_02640 [Bacteroidales bacterium]|nr:hypothetical protein [Bacteroidales bacterium]MDD4208858.1 hypothetical protein [Bacteroidales bacterium]